MSYNPTLPPIYDASNTTQLDSCQCGTTTGFQSTSTNIPTYYEYGFNQGDNWNLQSVNAQNIPTDYSNIGNQPGFDNSFCAAPTQQQFDAQGYIQQTPSEWSTGATQSSTAFAPLSTANVVPVVTAAPTAPVRPYTSTPVTTNRLDQGYVPPTTKPSTGEVWSAAAHNWSERMKSKYAVWKERRAIKTQQKKEQKAAANAASAAVAQQQQAQQVTNLGTPTSTFGTGQSTYSTGTSSWGTQPSTFGTTTYSESQLLGEPLTSTTFTPLSSTSTFNAPTTVPDVSSVTITQPSISTFGNEAKLEPVINTYAPLPTTRAV